MWVYYTIYRNLLLPLHHQILISMNTTVEFINDEQVKVVTKRGEELIGYLRTIPAKTDEEKSRVIDVVCNAFESTETCTEAMNFVSLCAVDRLLIGMIFEFVVTPIEAQRRRIGKRLRELREAKGISARELAFMTRIDPSNFSKIEQGKHAVGVDTLNKIAYYLDAEVQINFKEQRNDRPTSMRIYDSM